MTSVRLPFLPALSRARHRVRSTFRPMFQTAAAAVLAWYLARLVLPDERPAFAAIAAVISLGVSYGQRGQRAVQLTGGVVLGITVADVIAQAIGTGPPQIGVMVLLAMTAARAVGGGELLVSEAAVSAILLVTLDPTTGDGFSANRMLEAVIGGGVAVAVSSIVFPPDPVLHVGRAGQAVLASLARALERVATGLDMDEPAAAEAGLAEARAIEPRIRELEEALRTGRETARLTPPRRTSLEQLQRYERTLTQLDFAVRDTRVLARQAVRALRGGETVSQELPSAVRELELAVWELAAVYDDPARADTARQHAFQAASLASDPVDAGPGIAQVFGQVRSTAVDLRRAADSAGDAGASAAEAPTDELLLAI